MIISPMHIVTASAVVLNQENRIQLLNGPKRGWEIPGGRVEEGESLTSAVIRETKEDTGIEIEIIKLCGIFQNVKGSVCSNLFLGAQLSQAEIGRQALTQLGKAAIQCSS